MATKTLPTIETPWGEAIPPADGHAASHAITVHMPTWQTMLRFIERDPALIGSLKNMYPRMAPLGSVGLLMGKIVKFLRPDGAYMGIVLPSRETAEDAKAFATSSARGELQLKPEDVCLHALSIGDRILYAVVAPKEKQPSIMPYWNNAGTGISSRFADYCLENIDSVREVPWDVQVSDIPEVPAYKSVQQRIASLLNRAPLSTDGRTPVQEQDVTLFQCGMAAIYFALQYLDAWREGTNILFANAFHSTPHTLEDFGKSHRFFGNYSDYEALETFIRTEAEQRRPIQSLWAEFPANPLLTTPDIERFRKLADKYDFVLVIDDTIGSFANVDLLGPGGADVLVTSLTKSFSGYSDLMAGSVVLNPSSPKYKVLKPIVDRLYTNLVFGGDVEVLEKNSRDYMERSTVLNKNAATLTDYLHKRSQDSNSAIAKVWCPSYHESRPFYDQRKRPVTPDFTPGYGCLFSVELRTNVQLQAWYEVIGKHLYVGPHLGAHITLVMPYTKGLYGKELDRVAEYGLNERQVRISAGLEKDIDGVIRAFELAEKAAIEAEEQAANQTLLVP